MIAILLSMMNVLRSYVRTLWIKMNIFKGNRLWNLWINIDIFLEMLLILPNLILMVVIIANHNVIYLCGPSLCSLVTYIIIIHLLFSELRDFGSKLEKEYLTDNTPLPANNPHSLSRHLPNKIAPLPPTVPKPCHYG